MSISVTGYQLTDKITHHTDKKSLLVDENKRVFKSMQSQMATVTNR